METTHTSNRPPAAGSSHWLARPYLVRKKSRETVDTFTLDLAPPAEDGGFAFQPGQFNMLYAFGIGEIPISISGNPAKPKTLTHTIRAVGAVSRAIVGLKPGGQLGVRGPFGTGWPVTHITGRDVVIIAGGIGLAPLRPAVQYLLAHRKEYGKIILIYGARTPADIVYRKDLEKWRSRFDMEVLVTVDRAGGEWLGHVGVVTTFIGGLQFDAPNCAALVCGPEIMMRFTVQQLLERQVPENNISISMERNMKCGVGLCGHCQVGSSFVCKDGPVYCYAEMKSVFIRREM